MSQSDSNFIIYFLVIISAFCTLASGLVMIGLSFLGFRSRLNASMNMDLEIIRVSKSGAVPDQESGRKSNEAWREEIGAMEQLFTSLSSLKDTKGIIKRLLYGPPSLAFEIANSAKSEEIIFYMAVPKKFKESIEKQIHSLFPNAVLEKAQEYNIFFPGSFTAASTLQLKNKYTLPLRTYENLEVDPLNAITNALSRLETASEGAALQVVMSPAGTAWREGGRKVAQKMQQGKRLEDVTGPLWMKTGKDLGGAVHNILSQNNKQMLQDKNKMVSLTPDEQELVKSIERKSSKTGFKVNIRLLASAATQERAQMILGHLENAFSQYENGNVNCFLVKRENKKEIAFDYIFRNFRSESAIILNNEELASIFHIPTSSTEGPKIKWLKSNAAPPPINIPESGMVLGFNEYRGAKTTIRISDMDRRRHLYTIGQTGVGKSNFLQEMAKLDAKEGKGFCFIDPHGDAIEDILTAIPKERAEDVIIFDPSDTERPFGLNMMEYDPSRPEQKTFVINEMIGIFDQLYDLKQTGGPMFEQYMRNAMLLVMEDPETGSTLMEIPKVLSDPKFRALKLSKCANPVVVDFWTQEAEKAGGEAALANMVPYITSKLTAFISNDMMRPIIAQQKSTINFREIMDTKKILLINLSKGKIGEINARLLGMVVVGKILMNALSRADTAKEQRVDFYLYLDEFQNVTTNSIAQILSEARKYRLGLILAHQFIGQLKEDISKAVFGNVGSMLAFRVGPEDAEFLEKNFAPTFSKQDLVNVDNYQGFARVLIDNVLAKPFNIKTFPPTKGDQEIANAFKQLSRLKFGRDKDIVNREILERAMRKS